jgi:hypothetical protein
MLHCDRAVTVVEVDVADSERAKLTAPQAGVERGRPQRPLRVGQSGEVLGRLRRCGGPVALS